MRALLLRAVLPLLALGALATAGARPASAETLGDFAVQLGELNQRVQLWFLLANRDEGSDKIDLYKKQQAEDFKKKGHVKAEDLLAIVTAKEKDYEVRSAAAQAMKEAATSDADPEVQAPKRPGAFSPRGKFASEHLIRHITDKKADTNTRDLVHGILVKWFGTGRGKNQLAILNFKAVDEKTWSAASSAWKDIAREG